MKIKDEVEKDLEISDIAPADLQDELLSTKVIEERRKEVSKEMKKDNQMDLSGFYIMSMFQDCESYLRTKIYLVEDDIRWVLDE